MAWRRTRPHSALYAACFICLFILLLLPTIYYLKKTLDPPPSSYLLVFGIAVKMFGTVSDEREVKVPASEAWKLYGSLQLAKLVEEAMPSFVTKIDVLEGDGGAGTILELFFAPGVESGLKSFKETFTVVDDEKRVKVSEVVERGFLDLGFTLYRMRLEMIEVEGREKECCTTRATIEYELKQEAAANAALVSLQPLIDIMQLAAHHLERNYNNNNN